MSPQCGDNWKKSSFSDNGPTCVEVLFHVDADGSVVAQLRNSRQPEGPVLVFDRAEWEAFELGFFNHEFEMPR